MVKQYKSEAAAAAHDAARGLFECGCISKERMQEYDDMCYLTPVKEMTPNKIKKLRKRESASQADFAKFLNVAVGSVIKWERGERRPNGASLKLLNLVERHGLDSVA